MVSLTRPYLTAGPGLKSRLHDTEVPGLSAAKFVTGHADALCARWADGVAVFRGPTTMIGVDTIHEALFGKKVVKKHQDGLITAQTAADATIFMAPGAPYCTLR